MDADKFASMGPRSFNRGNVAMMAQTEPPETSFNGAAVIQPRKPLRAALVCPADSAPASMGPRSFNRGNRMHAPTPWKRIACASMGPRSFNRGNNAPNHIDRRIHPSFNGAAVIQPRKQTCAMWATLDGKHASMGPRSFNRGNETQPRTGRR